MNTAEELRHEREADRLLRELRACEGDYPAYSEDDLRRNARRRGEVRESDRSPYTTGLDGAPLSLLDSGIGLYDPRNPIDARSRIRPGYHILCLLISYASDLTDRQQAIVELTLAGLSLRRISRRIHVSVRAVSNDLNAAIRVMRQRREELEQDYDLERTAKLLHLQSVHLPMSARRGRLKGETSGGSGYSAKVRLLMVGAVKPAMVPLIARRRQHRRSLRKLAAAVTRPFCLGEPPHQPPSGVAPCPSEQAA